MAEIHPTAVVDPEAELGRGVVVGPFAFIGPRVKLGEGCVIGAHAVIEGWTEMGPGCRVWPGAIIGGEPQDLKFKGVESYVRIGSNCIFREGVTVHRSTQEGGETRLGDRVFMMAYSHVAHDCWLGDDVVITNYTGLSGHVLVEDRAFISGYVGVHQFCRIGSLTLVAAYAGLRKDAAPYVIMEGFPALVRGLNMVGLKRYQVPDKVREDLKQVFKLFFLSKFTVDEALKRISEEVEAGEEVRHFMDFVGSSSRGVYRKTGVVEHI